MEGLKSVWQALGSLPNYNSGMIMLVLYLLGSIIGGKISGLSFTLDGFTMGNILMCMLAKIFLLLVFISIYLVISIVGKYRTWLSMLLAMGVSMLLFMMIPSASLLNSTLMNVILSLVGGLIFGIGIGSISNIVLKKSSLV